MAEGLQEQLSGSRIVALYTRLVSGASFIFYNKIRYQGATDDALFRLDTALRRVLHRVREEHHLSMSMHIGGKLELLENELEKALEYLRQTGVDQLFSSWVRRAIASSADWTEKTEARYPPDDTATLRSIIFGLSQNRQQRYAALSILHRMLTNWGYANNAPTHTTEDKGSLLRNLALAAGNDENFELVSEVLLLIMGLDNWSGEIQQSGVLRDYAAAGLRHLRQNPTFGRFDRYCQVWAKSRPPVQGPDPFGSNSEDQYISNIADCVAGIALVTPGQRDERQWSPYASQAVDQFITAHQSRPAMDVAILDRLRTASDDLHKLVRGDTSMWRGI